MHSALTGKYTLYKLSLIHILCSESGIGNLAKIVPGGQVRCVSSYNGISAVSEKSDIVIIHDGARPFVTEDMLLNAIDAAVKYLSLIHIYIEQVRGVDSAYTVGL